MAKPRIFVSSTYYDLKHIRASLDAFIRTFGYEPVLFESGDILFNTHKPLDESCYSELKTCHMQILIIGGHYGSPDSTSKKKNKSNKDQYELFDSITKREFEAAIEREIPIYFFVDNSVLSEYKTFTKNRDNDSVAYAHVNSINVFLFIDSIYALTSGNYIKGFSNFEDISEWLKSQWAHLLAEFISNNTDQIQLSKLNSSVERLNEITSSLKEYTEAILNKVEPSKAKEIKDTQDQKHSEFLFNLFKQSSLCKEIKSSTPSTTDEVLFQKFNETENLHDFIKSALPMVDIDSLMMYTGNVLKKSYKNLKDMISIL